MSLPVVRNIRDLSPAPKRFLVFTAMNVVSWHSLVGPSLVLFARKIDMPPAWVGVLQSFMPLTMLIVLFTVPLVERFGPKRLMIATWTLRNFVASIVFAMPWALAWGGPRAGWYLLFAAILGFCVVRAMGAGAWFPWLHEFVPETQRGPYFSAETAVAQIVIVGLNSFHAVLLHGDPSLGRFLVVCAIAVAAGLFSNVLMARVPGGHRVAHVEPAAARGRAYAGVLRDRAYIVFVATVSMGFVAIAFLGASAVLYMRDILHCSPDYIMAVMTVGSLAVFLTVGFWSRFADASGPPSALALTLAGHGAVALGFLGLLPGAPWSAPMLLPLIAMANVLSGAYSAVAHRAMLDYIPDHDRVGYTNMWILGTSLALGLTPIAAGAIIQWGGFAGFEACFLIAGAGAILCAVLERIAVARRDNPERALGNLLSPAQPMRSLARIMWITAGLHPSNREFRGHDT